MRSPHERSLWNVPVTGSELMNESHLEKGKLFGFISSRFLFLHALLFLNSYFHKRLLSEDFHIPKDSFVTEVFIGRVKAAWHLRHNNRCAENLLS